MYVNSCRVALNTTRESLGFPEAGKKKSVGIRRDLPYSKAVPRPRKCMRQKEQ